MHPSHGLRAVRVGSVTGAGLAGWQANSGRSLDFVRKVPVRYWCPQGHETVPVFADLTEAEIPSPGTVPNAARRQGANGDCWFNTAAMNHSKATSTTSRNAVRQRRRLRPWIAH